MSRVQQGHTCRKNDEVDGYSVPNDFPFAEDALLEHVQRWRAKTPTDSLQWRIGASPVRFPPQRGTGEGAYPPRDNNQTVGSLPTPLCTAVARLAHSGGAEKL